MSFTFTDIIYLGTATPGSGGGGGGSGLPDQTGHSGEFLTTDGTDASWAAISGGLPSQTGQSGKFLTTNGTDASWATINALQNTATGTNSLTVLGTATTKQGSVNIGSTAEAKADYSVAIGTMALAYGYSTNVAIGAGATAGRNNNSSDIGVIAIGANTNANGAYAIQLGSGTNSDAGTFKVGLGINKNYELLSNNGTIPADRLPNAINKYSTMPTAASTNEGWIVQFTGATDSTYTHGHLYECVSDGGNPATYSWTEVQLGGGSSLPDPTGHAWKYLTNDGTTASWSNYSPLTNQADRNTGLTWSVFVNPQGGNPNFAGSYSVGLGASDAIQGGYGVGVGIGSKINNTGCIAVGYSATTKIGVTYGIAIGYEATVYNNCSYAIQLGKGINSTANTFSVGLSSTNNYRLLESDGTIPTARLTKANTTVTLAVADWSSSTQTVSVTGVTATSIVFVAPDSASQSDYTSAGILCTAQGAGTLTFTCSTTPTNAITVNVVAL